MYVENDGGREFELAKVKKGKVLFSKCALNEYNNSLESYYNWKISVFYLKK